MAEPREASYLTLDSWQEPPGGGLVLSPGTVHVWRAVLPGVLPFGGHALLSEEERARAGRIPGAARTRFQGARGVLRDVLARYLGSPPGALRFGTGGRGKPALGAPHEWLRFNVSHSGDLLLLAAVADREVGIDLEQLRPVPRALRIAERVLSPAEAQRLRTLPAPERDAAFLRCWTCKEAVVKAQGGGVWTGLRVFDVDFTEAHGPRVTCFGGSPHAGSRWTLRALRPAEDYVAALAVEGPIDELVLFEWKKGDRTHD